jgi:hypothetical protein
MNPTKTQVVERLRDAIVKAAIADGAFDYAVKAAGYKSRWDMGTIPQQSQALRNAYFAKVDADKAMGEAFAEARS